VNILPKGKRQEAKGKRQKAKGYCDLSFLFDFGDDY